MCWTTAGQLEVSIWIHVVLCVFFLIKDFF